MCARSNETVLNSASQSDVWHGNVERCIKHAAPSASFSLLRDRNPPVSPRKTKSAPFGRLGPDRITDELRAPARSPSHCSSYVYLGKWKELPMVSLVLGLYIRKCSRNSPYTLKRYEENDNRDLFALRTIRMCSSLTAFLFYLWYFP